MNGLMWAVAATVVSVDAGWQPLPEGGVEYIIQIDPQSLPLLKPGFYLTSEVPSEVREIRRYRITIGTERLPQLLPKPEPTPQLTPSTTPPATTSNRPPDFAQWPISPQGETPRSPQTSQPSPANQLPQPPMAESPHILPTVLEAEPIPAALHNALEGNTPGTPPGTGTLPSSGVQPAVVQSAAESKPWLPFVCSLLLLFASLGANAYLGWMLFEQRLRYRSLISQLHPAEAA